MSEVNTPLKTPQTGKGGKNGNNFANNSVNNSSLKTGLDLDSEILHDLSGSMSERSMNNTGVAEQFGENGVGNGVGNAINTNSAQEGQGNGGSDEKVMQLSGQIPLYNTLYHSL